MPTDNRTPAEIEREIERERAQLGSTIEELQDRFSPETILREVGRGFREHGGDIGHAVSRSVKENPIALALTGIGLAWMMFGRSYSEQSAYSRESRHDVRTVGGHSERYDPSDYASSGEYRGSEDFGSTGEYGSSGSRRSGLLDAEGRATGGYQPTPLERRRAFLLRDQDRYPTWASRDDDYDDDGDYDDDYDSGDDSSSALSRAGGAASSAGSSIASGASAAGSAVASGASSAGSAVKSGASSVASAAGSAGHAISGAAGSAYEAVARSYRRLGEGTEHMSEAARERIIAARASAVAARERAADTLERNWRYGRDTATDFYEEQPLVVGALAVAVGAALAGALPRTRYEDDAFGEQRDWLFDEAERIYHEERSKLEKVAGAAMNEAKSVLEEERSKLDEGAPGGKGAAQAVADEAKAAAQRISAAATSEAEKQKLGQRDKS